MDKFQLAFWIVMLIESIVHISMQEHYKLLYLFGALLSTTGIAYELRKNENRTNCG
jgi:hypothetical protein